MTESNPSHRFCFVVAIARHNVIGYQGHLPWRAPEDLKHFRRLTLGKPVIMGATTFRSIDSKPLPGRTNIVLTRHPDAVRAEAKATTAPDTALVIARSLREAVASAKAAAPRGGEIMIIGGAQVFEETLPITDRIYLTELDIDVPGDTFFPVLDPADWDETERRRGEGTPSLLFRTLDRRR